VHGDPILNIIESKETKLYGGVSPLTRRGPPFMLHVYLLEAAKCRRLWELGVLSDQEYEIEKRRQIPFFSYDELDAI